MLVRLLIVLALLLGVGGVASADSGGGVSVEVVSTRDVVSPGDVFHVVVTVRVISADPVWTYVNVPTARADGVSWQAISSSSYGFEGDSWAGALSTDRWAVLIYQVTIAPDAPADGPPFVLGFDAGYATNSEPPSWYDGHGEVAFSVATAAPSPAPPNIYIPAFYH
jgi:hypothetical protein